MVENITVTTRNTDRRSVESCTMEKKSVDDESVHVNLNRWPESYRASECLFVSDAKKRGWDLRQNDLTNDITKTVCVCERERGPTLRSISILIWLLRPSNTFCTTWNDKAFLKHSWSPLYLSSVPHSNRHRVADPTLSLSLHQRTSCTRPRWNRPAKVQSTQDGARHPESSPLKSLVSIRFIRSSSIFPAVLRTLQLVVP